jgi:hypothetical protein
MAVTPQLPPPGYILFSNDQPIGDGWQIPGGGVCQTDCQVIFHDKTTGWWFGGTDLNLAGCFDPSCGSCVPGPTACPPPLNPPQCYQLWLQEITVALGHLPTLGDVFPLWALDEALIDPLLHFNADQFLIVCSDNWINVPIDVTPPMKCPPCSTLVAGVCIPKTCPPGSFLNASCVCTTIQRCKC